MDARRSRRAMAADVLEQLSRTRGLSGTLVVTSDADAHALAADFGASVASDPIEPGINAAVSMAFGQSAAFAENQQSSSFLLIFRSSRRLNSRKW